MPYENHKMLTFLQDLKAGFPFPPGEQASEEGVLAYGGDLSPERLISAYLQGIFPWFSEGEPIYWWCPDPRFILLPDEVKISKSMRQLFNQKKFKVTFDHSFSHVIQRCASIDRKEQEDTWITNDMIDAYQRLHQLGFAHSVEVWLDDKIVGGLYGISIGKMFFGESMFSDISNSSKYGFITLVNFLKDQGFDLIDCQVHTPHLESLGAKMMNRKTFLTLIEENIYKPGKYGPWGS